MLKKCFLNIFCFDPESGQRQGDESKYSLRPYCQISVNPVGLTFWFWNPRRKKVWLWTTNLQRQAFWNQKNKVEKLQCLQPMTTQRLKFWMKQEWTQYWSGFSWNVVLGYEDTTRVTMDDMVHHTKAVVRGVKRAMVVADMPFLSYHTGKNDSVRNAGRLVSEGGCKAVKLEGGEDIIETWRPSSVPEYP